MALATSTFAKRWTGDYADFNFTTNKGTPIEHSEKVGNRATFDEQYANFIVIYNPDNPNEFQNYRDLKNYSTTTRVFFFFGIYLPFMTVFLFMFHKAISGVYRFFKSR